MKSHLTRRRFLRQATVATMAAATGPMFVRAVGPSQSANEKWDAENLKASNCPEADKYIRREYREGWTL